MPCRTELERQRLQEIYRTGRDPAEGNPEYAGGSMPPFTGFPGIPGFPPLPRPGPSNTPTRSTSPTGAPPAGGSGGMGDWGNGTWSTSGTMPPGYEDWIKEMMKQQGAFMKQNEELMKKVMTPSSGYPPMPPMPPVPGFPPMPPMPGMPGFGGSNGGFGGFPGVGAFSDGTNGPQTSTSFGELNGNSEKDEPGKKSWTSPDANSFINISVDYGDGDWEDPFEGEGKTGGGGFGDPDPASGSAPPRRKRPGARGPGRWQNYDEDAWDGRERPWFRDREDGEAGEGGGARERRAYDARGAGPSNRRWPADPRSPRYGGGSGNFRGPGRTLG